MSETLDESVVSDDAVTADETGVSDAADDASLEASGAAEASTEGSEVASLTPDQVQQMILEAQQQAYQQAQQGMADQLAQAFGIQNGQQAPAPPDPWSDNYAEEMQAWQDYQRQQILGEIQQALAPFQQQQTAQQAQDAIAAAVSAFPDAKLTNDDVDRAASAFAIDSRGNLIDPTQAARAGAEWLAARDKRIAEAAVKAYQESMADVANTRAEPGVGGGAVSVESTPSSYMGAADRWISRHQASE